MSHSAAEEAPTAESSLVMLPLGGNDSTRKSEIKEDDNFIEATTRTDLPTKSKAFVSRKFVYLVSLACIIVAVLLILFLLPNNDSSNENYTFTSAQLEHKRDFVRSMMEDAWNAYRQFAWGEDALRPKLKKSRNSYHRPGWTIVSAMSTLHVMKMVEQFEEGKQWIAQMLNFEEFDQIEVKFLLSDYLGGLLSCYALTREALFLEKAIQAIQYIEPAFNSSTGLLYSHVSPQTKTAFGKRNALSWIGHQQPELILITQLTENRQIKVALEKIKHYMQNIDRPNGLYMHIIDVESGAWHHQISTLGSRALEFYYNLMRAYLQSGGRDVDSLNLYLNAMKNISKNHLLRTSEGGLLYASEYNLISNFYPKAMSNSACRLSALLSLGATAVAKREARINPKQSNHQALKHWWQMAVNLTNTCYLAANQTKTKLLPIEFNLVDIEEAVSIHSAMGSFNGFYELAESYFFLWRLTHQSKYRAYAWELAIALQKFSKTVSGGYSAVKDVNSVPTEKVDSQSAHFLSATFKYLYLIFSEDSVLPLDKWIFNGYGQPLPICGQHEVLPESKCQL